MYQQYREAKAKHPDMLVLFRMGDFYELFEEDAEIGAKLLGLTITSRQNGDGYLMLMTGFPYHQLEQYLRKLIAAGKRVAVCEPVPDTSPRAGGLTSGQPGAPLLGTTLGE